MAWTLVREQGHLATSERNAGERKSTRVFVAVSDVPTSVVAAETAHDGTTGIPAIRSADPDDPGRRVVKVSPAIDPESPRTVFIVTVEASSKGEGEEEEEEPENPLLRPLECTWDFTDATEAYFTDRSKTPKLVRTSAGEQFEGNLERETGTIRATVTRNIPADAYDPGVAADMKDVVNADAFQLDGMKVKKGKAKLKAWTVGPRQTENGYRFRVATWTLDFRASWDDVVDDRGYCEKDPAHPGKLRPIVKGPTSAKLEHPWPLDGNGVAKAAATDKPATRTFKPYFEKSFARFQFA